MDYRDRHVVVTGGTGALGIAVVRMLVEAGAVCHVPYVHDGKAQRFPLLVGNSTASISSSSSRSVAIIPRKKSRAATRRRFLALSKTISPPRANNTSGISALGSA